MNVLEKVGPTSDGRDAKCRWSSRGNEGAELIDTGTPSEARQN